MQIAIIVLFLMVAVILSCCLHRSDGESLVKVCLKRFALCFAVTVILLISSVLCLFVCYSGAREFLTDILSVCPASNFKSLIRTAWYANSTFCTLGILTLTSAAFSFFTLVSLIFGSVLQYALKVIFTAVRLISIDVNSDITERGVFPRKHFLLFSKYNS